MELSLSVGQSSRMSCLFVFITTIRIINHADRVRLKNMILLIGRTAWREKRLVAPLEVA